MWTDVIEFRDFYATSTGHATRRVIRQRIRELWPEVRGLNVLGVGYATPYLNQFQTEAARVIAAMPAAQGVLPWPREGGGQTALVEDADLPFPDLSMDRVLLVHCLECSEQVRPMMREVWRVLAEGGRLLVVVPNRRGLWARLERTPFGSGRPYSPTQLTRLMRETLFTPTRTTLGLYMPPTRVRMMLSAALAWEEIGQRWFSAFAGVVIMEASKQLYAGQPVTANRHRRVQLPLVGGSPVSHHRVKAGLAIRPSNGN